jgi:hypothetical protein
VLVISGLWHNGLLDGAKKHLGLERTEVVLSSRSDGDVTDFATREREGPYDAFLFVEDRWMKPVSIFSERDFINLWPETLIPG